MDPFYDQFVLPSYSTQQKKRNTRRTTPDRREDVDPTRTDLLWVDKYEPKQESDLAVRPAKLKEVDACIKSSAFGNPPGPCKCLVFNGPAGSGKSTTIRTIAKARGYKIVEWGPVIHEQWSPDMEYESNMRKFENFLKRATQLQPLTDPNAAVNDQRRIILLDDIPDLPSDTARSQFQQLIESHLNDPRPFLIVIIISEAWMQTGSQRQTFNETRLTSVRDLLSPALVDSPRCTVIEFNPITAIQLKKCLSMIQDNEYPNTKQSLSKERLSQIAERSHGDIRNAINTLQFYCIPPLSHIPMKRKRDNQDTLDQTGERGAPLDLFHALGKVLYAKRDAHGKLESCPEDILRLLPVDSDIFVAYLQENMLKYFNDISSCSKALDWLCEADTIRSTEDWTDTTMSQYQCLISMRGIMSSRNAPVSGRLITSKKPAIFSVLSAVEKEPSAGLWNRGRLIAIKPDPEPSTWGDDIQGFSDEELDEFDEVFGDGSDIAMLEDW